MPSALCVRSSCRRRRRRTLRACSISTWSAQHLSNSTKSTAPLQSTRGRPLRQFIVKRALLTDVIDDLGKLGVAVARIDCWDEAGHAPLAAEFRLTGDAPPRKRGGFTVAIAATAAVATALGIFAGYSVLGRLEANLATLDAKAQTLRSTTAQKRAAEVNLRAAEATLAAWDILEKTTVPKLAVLDELTRLLPDTAWVTDLRVGPDGADINGFAASTVALLRALETSPLFVDATSTSAVTFDTKENKERFNIHVRLRLQPTGKQNGEGGSQ
jgi:general secretion pathway protein L